MSNRLLFGTLAAALAIGITAAVAQENRPEDAGLPPFSTGDQELPPGLAGRDVLPPGLAKKLSDNTPPGLARKDGDWLPPGLAKKLDES